MTKAVFLDRDGVINHDPGDYTKSLEEFIILPDVLEAFQLIKENNYRIILVTNQGGIAKELYPVENVYEIHNHLRAEALKVGVEIDEIYFAPYHDDYGNSLSRKPGSLMVERGLAKFQLNPAKCVLVGDKARDVESGEKVGVPGIQIDVNGSLLEAMKKYFNK
ncbi:MAG TPA: HAD-IIIA family hydrolase [Flavobacteriales bacterium]|nr:HAD-IIIA family hydrolase [Flavobacteriales bacterium]|tara:strand:- start:31531 stop:32019 length:489 start_codon:yes stop_codon:yes gene_type:complete